MNNDVLSDLKKQLPYFSKGPGIYLFLNTQRKVLYVGKARNLKKRIASYFRKQVSSRIASLMCQVTSIEVTHTETENQALLLECNRIKQLKPRYNILLRDDKSYPYIVLSDHPDYPRLAFYRGAKIKHYRYFGPFPSTSAVRETLNLLQRLFRLRSCEDSFFQHRSRPCLQYQIKRCTGPCVGLIEPQQYRQDVERTLLFLEGKNQTIIDDLVQQMEVASDRLNYELAARRRDQISALREIRQKQTIHTQKGDLDIIGLAYQAGQYAIYLLCVRSGRLLGGQAYFPEVPCESKREEVLTAFITQFYLQQEGTHPIPKQVIIPQKLIDQTWLIATLRDRAPVKVRFSYRPTAAKRRWLQLATENARQALATHLRDKKDFREHLLHLQLALQLDSLPQRLECFDISHSQGEATVASCVVFDQHGPRKIDYRRFNIEGIIPGDDYAAMKQALTRHYRKLKAHEDNLPDILILDGGKGQLSQAEQVLEELQISGIFLIGVAKGPTRRPGFETLFLSKKKTAITLPPDSLALQVIQQIRDEAHRFAITGHRKRRAKKRQTSLLERVSGIGTVRRRELLRQFGGLQALRSASPDEIAQVPGISKILAKRIYSALKE